MSRDGEDSIYWKGMFDAAIDGNPFVLENHPEHRLDWIYCKDVAEVAYRLVFASKTPHVEYNATYGKCMGIYDFKENWTRYFLAIKLNYEIVAKAAGIFR